MSSLQSLQLRLQQAVMAAAAASPPELVGDDIADAKTRLAVYRHGYRARLREALAGEFPTLASLAGRRFPSLLDRYAEACPSEHYNLRWHGAGMAAFLRYALPWRERPAFAEAAELDWAISTCFDAADEPAIGADALAAVAPDDWAGLRLATPRHLQWLALHSNVDAFRGAADGGAPRPHLRRRAQPRRLIVWRQQLSVRYRVLGATEAALLAAAARGETFATLCEIAAGHAPPGQAVARLAALLHGWVEAGLIGALEPAGT